jgi:hypothetical protein
MKKQHLQLVDARQRIIDSRLERVRSGPDLSVEQRAAADIRDALIDLAVTPNGRPGDASPLARPGYTGKRKLSNYEREIAHALMRKGKSKTEAIRMARGLLKKAASTGRWGRHGKAGAKTRAGAAASIAQRKTF